MLSPLAKRENMPVHYSADAYDRFTHSFLGRFDDVLVRRLLQELQMNGGGRRILDAGCGTARFLLRLASMHEFDSLHFTGLDYFADMVAVSRNNVRDARFDDRIAIVQGDVHRLPFESASFDFVVSRSTLHHLQDPAAALLEMRRVLAPGGVALIHEVRRDADPTAMAMFNGFREQAGVEPSRIEEKYSVDEIRQFVHAACLDGEATISAPMRGYASLGCEVRIAAAR